MPDTFRDEVVPLVENFHAKLKSEGILSPADVQSLASQLEASFQKIDAPVRQIHSWGYTPDNTDSSENTLGNSGINPFPPNALVSPSSEDEIISIIKQAHTTRSQVRVIGSAHSSPSNIILDAPGGVFPSNVILITLTKYRGVSIDKAKNLAVVKAGTNLHIDPEVTDSTEANSLASQLQKAGFAMPETGGVLHQTLGGFLSTGSAGGSLIEGFHDTVYSFTLIDGCGKKHVLSREDPDPALFFAAGVSVGLCGIITEITLKLTPTFCVTGTQQTSPITPLNKDWTVGCPVNLYGPSTPGPDGVQGIEEYFKDPEHEYTRMLYWPQPDLPPRVQIWTGKRTDPGEHPIVPYEELSILKQIGAMTALWVLWQLNYLRDEPIVGEIEKEIAGKILDLFLPLKESIAFSDIWYKTLPMDNSIQDALMPSCFSEFWFDMDQAGAAVSALKTLHESNSSTIGNYFTEFYCAKKSPFWLSPSFSGDKFRFDVTFFQYDTAAGSFTERADPADFFRPYFDYFDKKKDLPYNCHLGKYLPPGFSDIERLRRMYPKYDAWMKVRESLDPHQLFVTPYWRKHFLIPAPTN